MGREEETSCNPTKDRVDESSKDLARTARVNGRGYQNGPQQEEATANFHRLRQ